MTKTCKRCGMIKALTEFVRDKNSPLGRTTRCLPCERERVKAFSLTARGREYNRTYRKEYTSKPKNKAAKRQYDRVHYHEIREQSIARVRSASLDGKEYVARIKAQPCADCRKTYPPLCMDLDHVRGVKHRKLSALSTASKKVLDAEVSKCEVVCANCHQIRTEARREATSSLRISAFRARVNEYKKTPCHDCGHRYPPVVMQFDHVRGEKVGSISNMHGGPWARVLVEIEKCEVVCAVCHRLRTELRLAAA
jgi:hypothetical protein